MAHLRWRALDASRSADAQSVVTRQLFAFFGAVGGTLLTAVTLAGGRPVWALAFAAFTVAAGIGARAWSRQDPGPMPYFMRWILFAPRPFQSPRRVREFLAVRPGDRVLEIGPGIGAHAIPIAASLGPGGRLDVFDIQQAMLDKLLERARGAHLSNIVATRGDARELRYPDEQFDGAYLISVLGEIPDQQAALRELHRVLKPGGRVVIGEVFVDPDFIGPRELRERLRAMGFAFERRVGPPIAYLASFRRTDAGQEATDS